jgi:dipeptidyl aminopeptidase/acylaminoacyl peptidase
MKLACLLFYCISSMLFVGACFSNTSPIESFEKFQTNDPIIVSYGTWNSPITAEKLAEGSVYTLNMLVDDNSTYLCEMRPANHGRYTIVRRNIDGVIQDMTPPDFNVRTFVHEYGGGAFTVSHGVIYASNGDDHAIYIIKPNETPHRLTEGQTLLDNGQWKGTRFADMHLTPYGLVAIGEQHEPGRPVQNFIALIDVVSGSWKKIASGYDFYSSPTISTDGKKIAWICWNHPNMPWTKTELWLGEFENGGELSNIQQIGGNISESFFQPQWSPDGILYFVSDRHYGWWNIHQYENGLIENICPMAAEVAEPIWTFQLSTYAFLGENIVFTYNHEGVWKLALLDLQTKKWQKIERESSLISQVRSGDGFVQFLEQYSDKGEALVQIKEKGSIRVLELSHSVFEKEFISIPKHISFPSNNRIAHGFYYAPKNQHYKSLGNEKPPLIVMIHGGPTSQSFGTYQLEKQFWTSRGFAILDVNYGGSTGYGRDYRSLLDRNYGVVDVDDCVNGALFLAEQGFVDKDKLAIRGASSGGYTTLAALAFKNIFKAGASYYGIADLAAISQDTHKFEQSYLEQLIGENRALWETRSPINFVNQIHSPLILFQGEEDAIVPKNQSIKIYESLKQQGTSVDLHIYPGEGHGFRQAENIVYSLNQEAEFYIKAFGLHK